ncbi:MAG TPA: hypothetical protein VLQ79_01895 [Myxococcaceae bacterium]|nr:hypothetical protein [Myxococcaceae bacterium]
MNTLPLHPAVVHVPLGLALIMPLLLGALLWAVLADRLPGRVWLLAVALQGVILGAAAVSLRTGEQEEERVEERVGEAQLEVHQRAAQAFTVAAGATFGAVMLAVLLRTRRRPFALAGMASVVLSVAMVGLGIQAGHRGGALVHGSAGWIAPREGARVGQTRASEQDAPGDEDND